MTTAWFDGPYTQVRRADSILVPCTFHDEPEPDLLPNLADRLAPSRPEAPPGTLTPDNGRTVVLRVHGGAWCLWLDSLYRRKNVNDVPVLDVTDQHTRAPWKVYMTSNAPMEFKAMVPGTYEIPLPLPVEPIRETEPYFLRRYPHLDTRPLRERV